jgi:hypothetical protein
MNENVTVSACAHLDVFGDEANVVLFQLSDGGREIRDAEADMVEALSALCDEFRDGGIVRGRFK